MSGAPRPAWHTDPPATLNQEAPVTHTRSHLHLFPHLFTPEERHGYKDQFTCAIPTCKARAVVSVKTGECFGKT